jgi:hypothetical protein
MSDMAAVADAAAMSTLADGAHTADMADTSAESG